MKLPPSIKMALASLPPEIQQEFARDLAKRSKSLGMAYFAWLLLGWHYLYLGRVGMQFAFWFTGGFVVVGWIFAPFFIPGMVTRVNEDVALKLIGQYRMMHSATPQVVQAIIAPPVAPMPPSPPQRKYFCYLNNEVSGPFDIKTLRQLKLSADAQCCLEGSETWINYGEISA